MANDDFKNRLRLFDDDNLKNIVLTGTKIVEFNDSEVLDLLNLMTPQNMNVFLKTSDKSQNYDKMNSRRMLEYRCESIPQTFIDAAKTVSQDSFSVPS